MALRGEGHGVLLDEALVGAELLAGTLAEVVISEAYADDLVGHIVGPLGAPGVLPAESAELQAMLLQAGE